MSTVVAGLHAVGFFLLFALAAPHRHGPAASGAFGASAGLGAYTLGLRHAFDADHIAAIDNATRKLLGEGRPAVGVGFFFSLGHSTVVFALACACATGLGGLGSEILDGSSSLHGIGSWLGAGIPGAFLYLIAICNLTVLAGTVAVARELRRGECDEAELEHRLRHRGPMSRLYGRVVEIVSKPWQMYPIGFLFGLGFDTATEVVLLMLAAGAAGAGLPVQDVLCLPILFAAGMSLVDTLEGSVMSAAYGWALSRPVRQLFYNATITALSAVAALAIGSIELAGLLSRQLGLSGGVWAWAAGLDLSTVGGILVAAFLLAWAAAIAVWRFGGIEERWEAHLPAE